MSERLSPEQRAAAVLLLPDLKQIDAPNLCIAYNRAYDRAIDWHEFAYLLDDLARAGKLKIIQATGFTVYALPEPVQPSQAPEQAPETIHYCGQCGRDLGNEWILGPICGKCTRKNHARATGRTGRR